MFETAPTPLPAETILQVRGLSLAARDKRLLDRIDARIGLGRRTVVMGANGAGKSLFLRTLHGLVKPTQGAVLWHGRPLDRAARDAQAMVFQRPVLLRRSVRANLGFALKVKGYRGAERRAREVQALDRARLTDMADRPARVLSGGEQQRLAIARALVGDPQVLLLDEPSASLDPASTQAIEDLINDAHGAGVTIILVTHDAGQARRMGDDVIFLHRGRVADAGPADQVLHAPKSAAARAWLAGRLYVDPETGN